MKNIITSFNKNNGKFWCAVIVLCILFTVITYIALGNADINVADSSMKHTMRYLKNQCVSYDEILAADKAKSLIRLSEQASEVARDTKNDSSRITYDYLKEFADEQRLSGVIILDEALSPVCEYSNDIISYDDLSDTLMTASVKNILDYPSKIYIERVRIASKYFDLAVLAREDAKGLICCYRYQDNEILVINQSSIEDLLSGYTLDMDGVMVIAKENVIHGTNINGLKYTEVSDDEILSALANEKNNAKIKKIDVKDGYFGGVTSYRNYRLFVYYPQAEVFSRQRRYTVYVLFIYALLVMCYYVLYSRSEKKHMLEINAQLDTIKAISIIYDVNILIDLTKNSFKIFKISEEYERQIHLYKQNRQKGDTLTAGELFENIIASSASDTYNESHKSFNDINTLAERLKKKEFIENIYLTVNGNWLREIIVPNEKNENGDIVSVVLFTRNINDQKRTEIEYQQKLEQTTDKAVKANMAKTDFLRRMSHDVRTPLNIIFGMLKIGNTYSDDLDKQRYCRNKVGEAATLLLDMVNDILMINKLDSNNFELEKQPFDVESAMDGICSFAEIQAEEKNISVSIEKGEFYHKYIIGNSISIRQIALNILGNAVKYTPNNGKIAIYYGQTKHTDPNKVNFTFSCSDNGIGMSEEFQKHMFETFAQENSLLKSTEQGVGLGLAIVKKLVDKMNGSIEVKSTKNIGSTFTITIPAQYCDAVDNHNSARDLPLVLNEGAKDKPIIGLNVLVAEDNELNMEIVEFMLEENGAKVTKASNGREAAEIWRNSKIGEFDLVLLDLMMPVMNGVGAARLIRGTQRSDAKTVPIFAMTANTFSDDIAECKRAGMNGLLSKPLNSDNLAELLSNIKNN